MTRLYDEAMAGTGMTIQQFAILRNIDRAGSVPLSRLADALVMDRTSLYRSLAPLERSGWIERDEGAARVKTVRLTPAGEAAMAAATPAWSAAQARVLDEFGSENWRAASWTLAALADVARAGRAS